MCKRYDVSGLEGMYSLLVTVLWLTFIHPVIRNMEQSGKYSFVWVQKEIRGGEPTS